MRTWLTLRTSRSRSRVVRASAPSARTCALITSTTLKRGGLRGSGGFGFLRARLGTTYGRSLGGAGLVSVDSSGTMLAPVPLVAVSSTQTLAMRALPYAAAAAVAPRRRQRRAPRRRPSAVAELAASSRDAPAGCADGTPAARSMSARIAPAERDATIGASRPSTAPIGAGVGEVGSSVSLPPLTAKPLTASAVGSTTQRVVPL